MPYHAATFEKNPCSRSWVITLCNFEAKFGQNCPFDLKEDFGENFTLVIFFSDYCALSCCKVLKKKSLEQILWYDINLHNFELQLPKLPIWLRGFSTLRNFTSVIFIYFLCPIRLQNLKKSLDRILRLSLCNFWAQSTQNCPFVQIEDFFGS